MRSTYNNTFVNPYGTSSLSFGNILPKKSITGWNGEFAPGINFDDLINDFKGQGQQTKVKPSVKPSKNSVSIQSSLQSFKIRQNLASTLKSSDASLGAKTTQTGAPTGPLE